MQGEGGSIGGALCPAFFSARRGWRWAMAPWAAAAWMVPSAEPARESSRIAGVRSPRSSPPLPRPPFHSGPIVLLPVKSLPASISQAGSCLPLPGRGFVPRCFPLSAARRAALPPPRLSPRPPGWQGGRGGAGGGAYLPRRGAKCSWSLLPWSAGLRQLTQRLAFPLHVLALSRSTGKCPCPLCHEGGSGVWSELQGGVYLCVCARISVYL